MGSWKGTVLIALLLDARLKRRVGECPRVVLAQSRASSGIKKNRLGLLYVTATNKFRCQDLSSFHLRWFGSSMFLLS